MIVCGGCGILAGDVDDKRSPASLGKIDASSMLLVDTLE